MLETEDGCLFSGNSNYIELDNIKADVRSKYSLKIKQLNFHCLVSKENDFKCILPILRDRKCVIYIFLLCEHFLINNNVKLVDFEGYDLIPHDGGVAILLNNQIKYKEILDLSVFHDGELETFS